MALFDRNSSTHYITIGLECFVKILVGPLIAKAFDENVTFGLDTPQEIFVVGEGATGLAVQLGELDLLKELLGIQDVRESRKGVVKVLHLGPIDSDERVRSRGCSLRLTF